MRVGIYEVKVRVPADRALEPMEQSRRKTAFLEELAVADYGVIKGYVNIVYNWYAAKEYRPDQFQKMQMEVAGVSDHKEVRLLYADELKEKFEVAEIKFKKKEGHAQEALGHRGPGSKAFLEPHPDLINFNP
jgi:hypothetical protein